RKKIREYGGYGPVEHGWMNVMKIAYILGEEKWIDICKEALQFKYSIPDYKLQELYDVSLEIATPERELLKEKFKYTLDEILIKARKEGIAGMGSWDSRIGEDPLTDGEN
ncbi:hypothetical protein KAR91_73055, partial [Candidatus Pacearchaeota archaeon]|nr:hypothetical protein [Candidatus Pacearchaeota archaeon]